MLHAEVDTLTPRLKDTRTGELVETESVRIVRPSFLSKYNQRNGWYENCAALVVETEVYALVLQGTVDIQGLIAVTPMPEQQTLYLAWACVSPENNKLLTASPRYEGVGGHLFAIAARVSSREGFDGYMYGYAANTRLARHYMEALGADLVGILHPYHVVFDEIAAQRLLEVYDFDWTDERV